MQRRAGAARRSQDREGGGNPAVLTLLERVRAAGLKMTPQRIAIVRQVATDESHPSAQELFDRLRVTMPTMSFATVYNTLAALCAAGLGTSLSLAPGSARFDPNMHPHDHVVCDRCGAVRDVLHAAVSRAPAQQAPAKTVSKTVSKTGSMSAPGFTVRVVEQIFRGLCHECSAAPAIAVVRPRSEDVARLSPGPRPSRRPAKRKEQQP